MYITILQILKLFFKAHKELDPLYCPRKCGRCYKGNKRRSNLARHLKHECGVPKQFQCPYCYKCFPYKQPLRIHCANVHKYLLNL